MAASTTDPLSTFREQEQKYSVHGLFVLPDLADPAVGLASADPQPSQTLRAVYYDSPDLRLARDGITLRHRSGDGPTRWTLKLPAESEATPAPVAASRRDRAGRQRPRGACRADRSCSPAGCAAPPLGPVATLRTARSIFMLRGDEGEDLLEVVDDTVSVQEGRRVVSRFREIEVEVKGELPPLALTTVTNRLAAAGAVPGDQLPKVVRALGPRAVAPPELPARRQGAAVGSRPVSSSPLRCAPAPAGCCWPTSEYAGAKRTPCTRCGSPAAGCAAI